MKRIAPPLVSFGLCILVITLFLAVSTPSPLDTLGRFFSGTFSSWWYLGNMLNTAVLLIPAAIGSAVALRSGSLNLGGEAQLYAPALVTALLLSRISDTVPVFPVFLAVLLAALATGAVLAAIPGILRVRFHASELLTSFLLSAALIPLLDYLVAGPLRDPGKNLLVTRAIPETVRIPPIAGPSSFNLSVIPILLLAGFWALIILRTRSGYRMSMTGTAPEFAAFTGIRTGRITVLGMTLSGALHGLTGFLAVTGTWYTCHQGITSGMGWSALAVALIAGRHPLAIVPAAIIYAWIQVSGDNALLSTRVDFDSTAILQAVLFLVISARTIPSIVQFRRKRP